MNNAIAREVLEVAGELQRVAEYFEGPAEERGVRLVLRGGGDAWADPMLLRRALANLVANAVRYADPGSEIVLATAQEDGGTAVSVENRGPAIEARHLERLFDRFYRADPARVDSSASSGLGLSIVRSIMTLHQGSWRVASKDGVTRFTLLFPACRQ